MSLRSATTHFINRLNVVTVVILLAALGVIVRLFFLQVLDHDYYLVLAQSQQTVVSDVQSERGEIFLREKNGNLFTLATTKKGYDLYLEPRNIVNPDSVFNSLSSVVAITGNEFFKAADRVDDPYEVIKKRVSSDEGGKIRELGLGGTGLVEAKWRFYPAGSLASHAVGFVSSLSDEVEGKYGAEGQYENWLRSQGTAFEGERSGHGLWFILGEQFSLETQESKNLVLTLEPKLQFFLELELDKLFEKWNYKSAGAIIIEPSTGAVKALSARPNFNPNEYNRVDDLSVYLNPFTEKIFEMGSVFKPLTMAASIDAGAVSPETTYVDLGFVKFGDDTIHNFDGEARGRRTMSEVLAESLNTGAVFAMQKLGGFKLKEYFYKFGLGEKSGVDLPGEVSGNLRNLDSGREIEFATASFGQGIAVTPLGLTMALGTLANGGVLMRPYVSEHVGSKTLRRVLREETALTVSQMLVDVVDTTLAGGSVKMDGYSIAAKTGTAQIPDKGGGYSQEYLHSFFGYFPAYEPKFLIFIFLERPIGARYASQTLSEPFKETVEFLINYYTIPPDRAAN